MPRPRWWPRAALLLVITIATGALVAAFYAQREPDLGYLRWIDEHRIDWLTSSAHLLSHLAEKQVILLLRLALIVVLVIFRRWRHLMVVLVAFFAIDVGVSLIHITVPPPPESLLLAPVRGLYHFPTFGISSFCITLFMMVGTLVPLRTRPTVRNASIVLAMLVAASRIYLGTAYPLAAAYSILLAFGFATVLLGWLAPDEAFPVSYKRGGNAAHLALAGPRTEAIKRAMREQLGVDVTEVKSFGEEGSGGSTPMLMTTADGSRLFGKILATSHVRSDRWYRVGRTILYGRLEDETTFSSVRRLIEYEDYALRLLDDAGFRVARSYGIVELTPQREYLLPTEFFEGAETLGHAEVNDVVIDDGLQLVRRLWDNGLAHRDVKPANLLIVEGHLQVIDVSGLEVRPSSWRQAVDLANMMLVLSLRTDPERVYERALAFFSADEIGEAFASATGMAIPTELQRHLKEDSRPLIARFRELAPPHPDVSIQRWSSERIALTVAAVVSAVALGIWAVASVVTVL
ncbi:MAG: hypothetical protein ACJ76P_06770 [Actinomycetota bacterium]